MKIEINPRMQSRYKDPPQGKRKQDIWWNHFTCNKMKKSVVILVVVQVITWPRHQNSFCIHGECSLTESQGEEAVPFGLMEGLEEGKEKPRLQTLLNHPAALDHRGGASCALGLEKTCEEEGTMGTGETRADKDKEDQRVLRMITLSDAKCLKGKQWLLHGCC